jgi:AhpD family alkylhydroperoxidase
MVDICYDAQTSGGLLVAIAESEADDFLKALQGDGISAAAIIGRVSAKGSGLVHIKTDGSRKIPSPRLAGTPVVPVDEVRGLTEEISPTKKQLQQPSTTGSQAEEVPCCADAVTSAGPGTSEGSARLSSPKSDIAQIKAKFIDFLGSASSPHGLDAYTKQAMAIALSVAMRCGPCLKMHLKKAREKGFTQDEIDEAAWMGISFGGSPAMVFYEQLKNS